MNLVWGYLFSLGKQKKLRHLVSSIYFPKFTFLGVRKSKGTFLLVLGSFWQRIFWLRYHRLFLAHLEPDAQNLRLINSRFLTFSSHFSANYTSIFHKTEVQTVILRCWTGLNPNWFKSYDTKRKYFSFCIFRFCKKNSSFM